MLFARNGRRGKVLVNNDMKAPPASFYNLEAVKNDGSIFNFRELRDKHVLIVNTASYCGYTAQYRELQQLHERYAGRLQILAFPSDEFKQEKDDDETIADFCRKVYGVDFIVMKKALTRRSPGQNEVYRWLAHAAENGWNNHAPEWNFGKYLIGREGKLILYSGPAVSPLDQRITAQLET